MRKNKLIFIFMIVIILDACAGCIKMSPEPTELVAETDIVVPSTLTASAFPTQTPTAMLIALPSSTQIPSLTPPPIIVDPSVVISADTAKDLKLLSTLTTGFSRIGNVAISQDGGLLGATPWEGTIKLWNVATLEEMETSVIAESETQLFSRSANQISVVKSIITKGTVQDLTTGELLSSFTGHLFSGGPAVSSNGSMIAVSSVHTVTNPLSMQNIVIKDLISKKTVQTLYGDWRNDDPHDFQAPDTIFFSPDDTLLAATITDGRSIVWDVASGERVAEFENTKVFAFSHDGTMLAASVSEHLIAIYDTATWKLVNTSMYNSWAKSMVFTLDDELLIVGSRGGSTIWDWKTGELVHTLSPSGSQILLSADGTLLVSYNDDYLLDGIYLWGVP